MVFYNENKNIMNLKVGDKIKVCGDFVTVIEEIEIVNNVTLYWFKYKNAFLNETIDAIEFIKNKDNT